MSGMSSALQRLFTEVWVGNNGKSVFDRIYIFSPSVGSSFEDGIDETWTPVKCLVETQLIDRSNPMHSREQYFFDELDKETMDNPTPWVPGGEMFFGSPRLEVESAGFQKGGGGRHKTQAGARMAHFGPLPPK